MLYSEMGITGLGTGNIAITAVILILAYLLGNINPTILQAKACGIDIRQEGSGNPGTTNALRVLGKKAAGITLLVDILKGTFAVVLAGLLFGEEMAMFACLWAFLGHCYPVFFRFKGGKGVATAFGALSGLHPAIGFGALGIVLLAVAITRIVSASSLLGAIFVPILSYFLVKPFAPLACVMAIVVFWRHRTNIERLVKGKENKLSFKSKGQEESGDPVKDVFAGEDAGDMPDHPANNNTQEEQ